jgi:hypothetical protein
MTKHRTPPEWGLEARYPSFSWPSLLIGLSLLSLILWAFSHAFSESPPSASTPSDTFIRCLDGDTCIFAQTGTQRVRLAKVDAAELNHPVVECRTLAQLQHSLVEEILLDASWLYVQPLHTDRYDRSVALVYVRHPLIHQGRMVQLNRYLRQERLMDPWPRRFFHIGRPLSSCGYPITLAPATHHALAQKLRILSLSTSKES